MKVIVLGTLPRIDILQKHPFANIKPIYYPLYDGTLPSASLEGYDWIVDLNLEDNPQRLSLYNGLPGVSVLGSAVKKSLGQMVAELHNEVQCSLFGMNALPGFLQNPGWEISAYRMDDMAKLPQIFSFLPFPIKPVQDRVGMVSARVVCQIINEAYMMLQEGSATQKDIEQAMKLGVNYPQGPFEWAEKIGLDNVFALLEAMGAWYGTDAYAIAPLLRQRHFESIMHR